jgi:hypothetical protein
LKKQNHGICVNRCQRQNKGQVGLEEEPNRSEIPKFWYYALFIFKAKKLCAISTYFSFTDANLPILQKAHFINCSFVEKD